MALPAIGSFVPLGTGGKLGVVVAARPLCPDCGDEDRELVAVRTREVPSNRGSQAQTTEPQVPDAVPRFESATPVTPVSGALETAPERRPSILDPDRPTVAPGARHYEDLAPGERETVDRLRQRDAQVRQEETAHAAVAGDLAGPISYVYQSGPDGRLYAIGGSVPLAARNVTGDAAEARDLGARMAAAAQAATNPSDADLAAAHAGYRLQNQAEERPGATLDVSA